MVRTQVCLTKKQRDALAALAKVTGKKQSELIRQAIDRMVDHFSPEQRKAALAEAAGLWKDRNDLPDFGKLRREWDRD